MSRRRRYNLEPATFQQTVILIQTLPRSLQMDREAIIARHLSLGFDYNNDQIWRAIDAVTDLRAREWDHRQRRANTPSGRWT